LDFLAEVTQHIPDLGVHLVRYYGWYSNKTRGQRAQREPSAGAGTGIPARSPTAPEARKGWAALIKQVYEADPLGCPLCPADRPCWKGRPALGGLLRGPPPAPPKTDQAPGRGQF